MCPKSNGLRAALCVLLLSATVARAQEAPLAADRWQPEAAAHFGGPHGLTGFGSMVDGRIPSPFLAEPQTQGPLGSHSSRFTLRYDLSHRRLEVRGEQGDYESRVQRHTLTAAYGFTVQGLDVGLSVPFVQEYDRLRVDGGPRTTDRSFGAGDVVVALKAAFRIPKFWFGKWAIAAFGPYALGRVPTGTPPLRDAAEIECGVALAGPYGGSFRWHGNLALLQRSGGLSALVYRFGASAVPVASDGQVLRVYASLSGVEFEGPPNSSVDLELGGQLLFGGMFTVDLGVSLRLVDAGFTERGLERRVKKDAGDRIQGVRDEGTVAVTFGIGVLL